MEALLAEAVTDGFARLLVYGWIFVSLSAWSGRFRMDWPPHEVFGSGAEGPPRWDSLPIAPAGRRSVKGSAAPEPNPS